MRTEYEQYQVLKDREGGDVESVVRGFRLENRVTRAISAASCWHEGARESAALWHVYSGMDSGICVRTTSARLRKSMEVTGGSEAKHPYFLGRVRYIDYETETIQGEANTLWPLIYKRSSFEHEHEVRAVIVDWSWHESAREKGPDAGGLPGGGLAARVSVSDLIDHVLVAPESPDWFLRVVQQTTDRLGFRFPVQRSSMTQDPIL